MRQKPTTKEQTSDHQHNVESKRCTCGWEYPRFLEVKWFVESAIDRVEYTPDVAVQKGLATPILQANQVVYCPNCGSWLGPPGSPVDLSGVARTRDRREFARMFVDLFTQPDYIGPLPSIKADLKVHADSVATRFGLLVLVVGFITLGVVSWVLGERWFTGYEWWLYIAAITPIVLALLTWRRVRLAVYRYLYAKELAGCDTATALDSVAEMASRKRLMLTLLTVAVLIASIVLVLIPEVRTILQDALLPGSLNYWLLFALFIFFMVEVADDSFLRNDITKNYRG